MHNALDYSGVVTLTTMMNGKIVSQKHHNNGTTLLFETIARALTGQPITRLIPSYLDIGYKSGSEFVTHLKDLVPVIVTYMSGEGYDYGVPFTRVEAIITKEVFHSHLLDDTNCVQLRCGPSYDTKTLAEVPVKGFKDTVKQLGPGVQMILVWDLYVKNKETTSTPSGGES